MNESKRKVIKRKSVFSVVCIYDKTWNKKGNYYIRTLGKVKSTDWTRSNQLVYKKYQEILLLIFFEEKKIRRWT